jgi:restriction system protein
MNRHGDSNAVKSKRTSSQFARYVGPVIEAIRELGGSGRPDEVRAVIARELHISEAEQSEPLPSGVQTRFENQVHWARFYLAKAGYIDSSQRGVWTLTEKGRALGSVTAADVQSIVKEVSAQTKPDEPDESEPAPGPENTVPSGSNYREELARMLQSLPVRVLSGSARGCCASQGFRKSPSPVGPEMAASTA